MNDNNEPKTIKFTVDYDDEWTQAFFTCMVQRTKKMSDYNYKPEMILVVSDGSRIVNRTVSLDELDKTINMLQTARKTLVKEQVLFDKLERSGKSKKVKKVF
jgi:hypothetical protein